MWFNNRNVLRTYASYHAQNAYAIISGIAGWKRIRTGNPPGVTNIHIALCAARANNRLVDVYIVNNLIERVVLK